jgi:hypothetical protein
MTWPQLLNGHSEGLITVDCGCHASTRLTSRRFVRARLGRVPRRYCADNGIAMF